MGEPRTGGSGAAGASHPGRRRGVFRGKRPIFQFVGLFVVFMGAFYACAFTDPMNKGFLPYYMQLNARMSTRILNWFGENAAVNGTSVSSQRYQVDIKHGCDAVAPSVLFISAVLAFPSPILSKLPGLLAGTLVLAVINLIRIVSLFYIGIHWNRYFETMHEDVWQAAFILLALLFWVIWAWWATGRRASRVQITV